MNAFELGHHLAVGGGRGLLHLDHRGATIRHFATVGGQEDHRRAQSRALRQQDRDGGVGFQIFEFVQGRVRLGSRGFASQEAAIQQIDNHQQEGLGGIVGRLFSLTVLQADFAVGQGAAQIFQELVEWVALALLGSGFGRRFGQLVQKAAPLPLGVALTMGQILGPGPFIAVGGQNIELCVGGLVKDGKVSQQGMGKLIGAGLVAGNAQGMGNGGALGLIPCRGRLVIFDNALLFTGRA